MVIKMRLHDLSHLHLYYNSSGVGDRVSVFSKTTSKGKWYNRRKACAYRIIEDYSLKSSDTALVHSFLNLITEFKG